MKKLLFVMLAIFCVLPLFAKSYLECLGEAKKYEEQKRWCYALGSYYDALGTDELPENKVEAKEGYNRLKNAIISGNPGLGSFNVFDFHDEWKNLLIDAEKYGSSICIYDITVGDLERGALDYTTRTATYNAKIDYRLGDRYNHTILIIEQGYKTVYKSDWTDLPEQWPLFSASTDYDAVYNIDGALVYTRDIKIYDLEIPVYINAFYELESKFLWDHETAGLYDYKFNIVDENGKELVKGKRWLLGDGDKVSFSGISPELMDIIDSGKAFVNPVGCYLQYGKYNSADDKGGRTFMKNFPEVQLSMEQIVFICWNNTTDRIAKNCFSTEKYGDYSVVNDIELITIDNLQVQFLKTEVTQRLYKFVMDENPSYFWGDDLPVESISWYDAIYFCNKLSEIKDLTPVYSVNGSTNTSDWNYTPHKGKSIDRNVEQNELADGFRLPTSQEWEYAAKGGENYNYAGNYYLKEVGWYNGNSKGETHPIAQKKPNGYGLYDMSGNVWEWAWNEEDVYIDQETYYHRICGGSWNSGDAQCVCSGDWTARVASSSSNTVGFRIVRRFNSGEIFETQQEAEQEQLESEIKGQRIAEEQRGIAGNEKIIKKIIDHIGLASINEMRVQVFKTEVTQALYEAVMGNNPSYFKGDDLPVENISWYDAIYFCNKLSEIMGLLPVYIVNGSTNTADWKYTPHTKATIISSIIQDEQANGFRLPTKEEWQYAAKGGESYKYAGNDDLDDLGWYKENSDNKTHPVAQKEANSYGLYDMSGNVKEWCWDAWGNEYRVMMNGSYLDDASTCRITKVNGNLASTISHDTGFRIVQSIK